MMPVYGKKKKHKQKEVAPVTLTQEQRIGREQTRKFKYFYFEAVNQQNLSNYAAAFDLFQHALDIDPESSEAHHSIARYYEAMQQDSIARMHYERAVALEPQNGEYLENLGELYLQQNEIAAATELYEKVSLQYPDRTELLEILMRIYEYEKDYPNLLRTLNRIETAEGTSENLTLSKLRAYSMLNDDAGALAALDNLVKSYPNDLNYQVMLGNWSLSKGKKEEAYRTFQKVLEEEPGHAKAQMSMMDYYRHVGRENDADSLMYMLLENPKTESSTRITMMRDVIKQNETSGGDSTRILNIFRRVLALPQKTNEMAYMQAAYMEHINMPKDSIRHAIERVLEITPEDIAARLSYIGYLWEDSIDENVIRECRKGTDYAPKELTFHYYLGLALYINDRYDESIAAFRNGVAAIDDDSETEMCSKMYMLLGDVLHKQGFKKEAYEAYDSCLVYNPDEISCLNNYAYFLSCDNKDLERAEKMSYKTVKAEPRNSTYLDTYAWILYMQERYEEARIYMDQVLMIDAEANDLSADVISHAIEIFIKVGEVDKAQEYLMMLRKLFPEDAEEKYPTKQK